MHDGDGTYPSSDLLDGFIAVRLASRMGAEEERLWLAVVESYKTVFPIPDMVAKSHIEYNVAQVEAVEIKPKGIDNAIPFVHYKQDCRCIAASARCGFSSNWLTTVSFSQFFPDWVIVCQNVLGFQFGRSGWFLPV